MGLSFSEVDKDGTGVLLERSPLLSQSKNPGLKAREDELRATYRDKLDELEQRMLGKEEERRVVRQKMQQKEHIWQEKHAVWKARHRNA